MKKIEKMHNIFGLYHGNNCGKCSNIVRIQTGNSCHYKCSLYGITASQASDWRLKWTACGMFCRKSNINNVMRRTDKIDDIEIDGQIGIGDVE